MQDAMALQAALARQMAETSKAIELQQQLGRKLAQLARPRPRPHVTDGGPCWCGPAVESCGPPAPLAELTAEVAALRARRPTRLHPMMRAFPLIPLVCLVEPCPVVVSVVDTAHA